MVPLNITTQTICAPDKALANVRHALSLPHPFLHMRSTVSICGAGPSLAKTYQDLKGDVLACNSAIGWLADRGVYVHAAMMFDADPRMVQFARRLEGCRYYLASRCDPAVFEALKGMDIVVWHAAGEAGLDEMLEELTLPRHQHAPLIMGGSAAVTRALYLARAIGYTDIHVHGADSSFDGDTHVAGSIAKEERFEVYGLGRKYTTTAWMAQQAKEFEVILPSIEATGCTVTVHGDGLLPDIWRWMRAGS